MRIVNPADGSLVAALDEDSPQEIAGKYARARAAQPAWAARPIEHRLAAIRRFKALVKERAAELAGTLTREMGKPIAQSRAELSALDERLEFFLEHTGRALAPEDVLDRKGMLERITHEPLGVIANVSAWNYPYFVGANVFVPALLAGNAVLYKPSELAALDERLEFFLEHSASALAPEDVLDRKGMLERITHEPLGVVANVSAWNYPYFVGANVFVPALLAGNAVLYKPSELASQTGLAIGGMLHASGVPGEVFAVVTGAGAAGAALVAQPVDGVFFTGSYATGARIAAAVAPRMIRLQLELGGKDPVYVCEDVDPARAAAAIADGAFYNTGQSCCAVERIYVHRRVWEAFLDAFVATVGSYRLGDPLDDATYIGALARRDLQIAVLERQVADAVARGARALLGGARVARPGHFFAPTVLVDVDHGMQVMREESFGPLIGLMPVADDDEALALVRDTDYGLTAAVYTADRRRAERLLAQVGVGTAYWNCCDRVSPRLPWSGRGHSGVGATLSLDGIRAFLAPKAWHLRAPV